MNEAKYVERLSVSMRLDSFTVTTFEGAFDSCFKLLQVQLVLLTVKEYLILLSW